VLAGIPAAAGEIETADEGDRVVDDDDLLMLRRPGRVMPVEAEVQASMGAPSEPEERQRLALEREHDGEVPVEHVDVEVPAAGHDRVQEIPELVREVAIAFVAAQTDATVHVPPDDQDRALGPFHRLGEGREVGLPVDRERDAMRPREAPAAPALDQDRRGEFR
jgi:hypothetical protein